jgi:hypothetical protein
VPEVAAQRNAPTASEAEDFGPPTGNRVEITGMTIERFAERKIVED